MRLGTPALAQKAKGLIVAIFAAWLGAPFLSLAGNQDSRFIEFPGPNDIVSYDLRTVQMIQPGRFTIISTRIDHPDVMKFELKVLDTLRTYCTGPDGQYRVPADVFTLGPPDGFSKVEDIKVETWPEGAIKTISWRYPYSRLFMSVEFLCDRAQRISKNVVGREYIATDYVNHDSRNYRRYVARIINGSRLKELFDCKRGLTGTSFNENDDPVRAHLLDSKYPNPHYLAVCQRVTQEPPYLPK